MAAYGGGFVPLFLHWPPSVSLSKKKLSLSLFVNLFSFLHWIFSYYSLAKTHIPFLDSSLSLSYLSAPPQKRNFKDLQISHSVLGFVIKIFQGWSWRDWNWNLVRILLFLIPKISISWVFIYLFFNIWGMVE